ncbi:MAG: xylulokinase [Firmicutes bacterium]|nr:xylulokinase [Bacillota bacterium]
MESAYVGWDVGTQALKAVVVDRTGRLWWEASAPYATQSPQPTWFEQAPEDWLSAYTQLIEALTAANLPVRIAGMGFTGQMHTTVVTDAAGTPLRPAILWSDLRASGYGPRLTAALGAAALASVGGNAPLANFSALRLLWLRDHEPDVYRRIRRVAVAKDWLRNQVSDTWMTEVTDASGTLLFDVARRQWAEAWAHDLGLETREWFGPAVESATVVGTLTRGPEGLRGVPVVAGAGDQEASAVGTAVVTPGTLGISLGTSGVVFVPTAGFQPPQHAAVHAFCHAVRGLWHWMAVTQAAALSWRWFRDAFFPAEPYEALEARVGPVASEGLWFFPYLQGERAPLMNARIPGILLGLRPQHTVNHIGKAVLEGVTFSLYHAWTTMRGEAAAPRQAVLTGGGSRSALWAQMVADVFACPVQVVSDAGAAAGAAWLACQAIEGHEVPMPVQVLRTHEPGPTSARYREAAMEYIHWAEQLNALWQDSENPG